MDAAATTPREDWPLSERPGFLARRLHQIHVGLFSELCGAFRVTPLQYSLLSTLASLEEADQTTLAKAVALDRTTTTGALKRLESRGLVRRKPSEQDRRAQVCQLTDEGASLCGAMSETVHRAHDMTVETLTPAEREILVSLLKRIVAAHDGRRGSVLLDD